MAAYEADARYEEREPGLWITGDEGGHWHDVVEDTKSPATQRLPVYRLKRKLLQAIYGITIREVR